MSRVFWDTNLFIYLFEDFGGFTSQSNSAKRMLLAEMKAVHVGSHARRSSGETDADGRHKTVAYYPLLDDDGGPSH